MADEAVLLADFGGGEGVFGLQFAGEAHELEAELGGAPGVVVGNLRVEADGGLAGLGVGHTDDAELEAGEVEGAEFFFDHLAGDGLVGDAAENVLGADTAAKAAEVGAEAGHGVALHGGEIGDAGGGGDPGETGLAPAHGARPPAHGDDGELAGGALGLGDVDAAGGAGFADHAGEFAHGEAVDVGHAEGADVAHPGGVERRAVDLEAAEGIGAVEDDDLFAVFEAGLDGELHRAGERVAARADVLQVDDEGIDVLQLGGGGLEAFAFVGDAAVERIDHDAGARIDLVGIFFLGGEIAVDAVFAGVEGDEFHAGRAAEDLDGADAVAVDAGGVGEEADAFALHGGETLGFEDVDPEHDPGGGI